MVFSEEILDLGYNYGAQGGPEFSVTSTVSGGGYEKTNLDWSQPKGQWQIGDRTGEDCLDLQEYEYLYSFWMSRRGSFEGFRYKDWGDYELLDEWIGVGNGVQTAFQITKTYGSFVRVLKKIDPKGFSWQIGFTQPPAVLNPNTGMLTFSTPPAAGADIRVSGEFHVPVRFVENVWSGRFYAANPDTGQRFYELGSLQLRGIRV